MEGSLNSISKTSETQDNGSHFDCEADLLRAAEGHADLMHTTTRACGGPALHLMAVGFAMRNLEGGWGLAGRVAGCVLQL